MRSLRVQPPHCPEDVAKARRPEVLRVEKEVKGRLDHKLPSFKVPRRSQAPPSPVVKVHHRQRRGDSLIPSTIRGHGLSSMASTKAPHLCLSPEKTTTAKRVYASALKPASGHARVRRNEMALSGTVELEWYLPAPCLKLCTRFGLSRVGHRLSLAVREPVERHLVAELHNLPHARPRALSAPSLLPSCAGCDQL